MTTPRDELLDDLIAVLGAGRELSPDADRQLAELMLRRMQQAPGRAARKPLNHPAPARVLVGLGAIWGAVVAFLAAIPLFFAGMDKSGPAVGDYLSVCLLALGLLLCVTIAVTRPDNVRHRLHLMSAWLADRTAS